MKLHISTIKARIEPALVFFKHSYKWLFAILLVSLLGFLILRINILSNAEPSAEQIDEVVSEVKRPRLDKDAIAKIQELEDQNVTVQSLFQEARNNPFSE